MRLLGMSKLPEEAGFAHAGFAHHGHDLAVSGPRFVQGLPEDL